MKLTKNDMARVIVQALFALDNDTLPANDNVHVLRIAKQKKEVVVDSYKKAHKILTDKIR